MIVSESDVFNLEISTLFFLSTDFKKRLQWDHQTNAIGFIEGHSVLKKGAKVYTESVEGVKMDTEYLEFDFPHKLSIQMRNKSSVFKSFKGTWQFSEISNTETKLKLLYQFKLRFPYILIAPIVYKRTRKNMRNKLSFLSAFLNSQNKLKTFV